ncbi:MAG: hypothetical protein DRJ42_07925 [Deltaproteobacteria bacterium]|nr:MAG: hypothetical protein DRJ42_07925 [Deltaproteobacteria bacterium]
MHDAVMAFSPDLPSGAEGMRALLSLIQDYCEVEDPGDDADRAFVEGAGAALALLLIARVGEGEHRCRDGVHRIRIGTYGYFDPFGAIEEVLDADDPGAALAAAIRSAEAEAGGRGPGARVRVYLADVLSKREPPLEVREHFEHYLKLSDETEVDLSRTIAATRDGDDADVHRSVDKLVAFLGGRATALPWDEAGPRLVPRLVPPSFAADLPEGAEGRGELAIRTLLPSLSVALLVAHDGRSRFLREDELDAWDRSFDEVLERAVENLAARSTNARFTRLETDAGPLIVARSGDGLDAARFLLPNLHEVISREIGTPFYVAVPHRDTLLAAPLTPEALVAELERRAEDDAARAPHRISSAVYRMDESGFSAARGRGS